jgi:hypothetical protein
MHWWPDMIIEKEWITKAGYKAQVVAQPMGHRCGYVTVPEDHPCFGKDYNDIDIEVHGGLTFAHDGEFGFDCAHFYDAKDESLMDDVHKRIQAMYPSFLYEGTVRTLEFCINECENMAKQFKELA